VNAEEILKNNSLQTVGKKTVLYSDSQKVEAWMVGFPPAKDRVISFADNSYRQRAQIRWSYSHMQELVPTKTVW